MSAISHIIGGDLVLDESGGLAIVSDAEQARQEILRRLCTNAGAYIWQPDYGAGLPARVGEIAGPDIEAVVMAQMRSEAAVDQSRPITVTVAAQGIGQYLCTISYTDAQTQSVQGLSFQT